MTSLPAGWRVTGTHLDLDRRTATFDLTVERRAICRMFGVRPRDIGIGVETPHRSRMHAAYRAKTRRTR